MLKAYKYLISPTNGQAKLIDKHIGCSRFIYNLGLETKIRAHTSAKKNLSCFDLHKQLTELKNTEATWLADCPSQALQMSLRNLDNAYTKFFKGGGFPKFKNKYSKQSLQFPQQVVMRGEKIKLPKLGLMDMVLHRPLGEGSIKMTTVSLTTTRKYFISILIDNSIELPKKKEISENSTVGIDLGIKDLAILSDGTLYANNKFLRKQKSNLKRQQRSLARKTKGSKRRDKQKMVVARVHEKIRNQRMDYLHKVSTDIVTRFDTICLEDLNIQGMIKNKNLSLAISEIGWYEFITMLKYKAEWNGKNIIQIGRFEPSSKICSDCGEINNDLTLSVRKWTCKGCGSTHDRDMNAAKNIKNFGLRGKPTSVKTGH